MTSELRSVFIRFRNDDEHNPHSGEYHGVHATLEGAKGGAPDVEHWSERAERWVGSDGETNWVIFEFDVDP